MSQTLKAYIKNVIKESKSISYSAIVLDEASMQKLKDLAVEYNVPDDWELVAHHMTIKMGALVDEYLEAYPIGDEFKLTVTHFGMSDKAAAVKVKAPGPTKTSFPHITVAVNRSAGGKPFDSNKIAEFSPIDSFVLTGTVEEVPNS